MLSKWLNEKKKQVCVNIIKQMLIGKDWLDLTKALP